MPRSKLEALTPPLPSAMDNEQPCDLRLLTPATCLRELANASTQQQRELMAVAAGIAAAMPTTANTGGPNTTSLPLSPMYKGITMTSPSPVPSTIGGAYTCSRCGNSYARPHSLNRHIRFECGVEPKFECPVCHKKSKHKHNLVLHMRTHQHR